VLALWHRCPGLSAFLSGCRVYSRRAKHKWLESPACHVLRKNAARQYPPNGRFCNLVRGSGRSGHGPKLYLVMKPASREQRWRRRLPPSRKNSGLPFFPANSAHTYKQQPADEFPIPSAAAALRRGKIIAERYRVVALAGRGGMGRSVPRRRLNPRPSRGVEISSRDAFRRTPRRLRVFHAEVRTARQVSHPNVCRMFDIRRSRRNSFPDPWSMSTGKILLRWSGASAGFSPDKATEVARQICAGLAAAHETRSDSPRLKAGKT